MPRSLMGKAAGTMLWKADGAFDQRGLQRIVDAAAACRTGDVDRKCNDMIVGGRGGTAETQIAAISSALGLAAWPPDLATIQKRPDIAGRF